MVELIDKFKNLTEKWVDITKLWDFLDHGNSQRVYDGIENIKQISGDIVFRKLDFAYEQ
jgi:hypothetical protein